MTRLRRLKFILQQDFVITEIMAFLWLFAAFGFTKSTIDLKTALDEDLISVQCDRTVAKVSSFLELNFALVRDLNLFSDLK